MTRKTPTVKKRLTLEGTSEKWRWGWIYGYYIEVKVDKIPSSNNLKGTKISELYVCNASGEDVVVFEGKVWFPPRKLLYRVIVNELVEAFG